MTLLLQRGLRRRRGRLCGGSGVVVGGGSFLLRTALGSFDLEQDAARAYDAARVKYRDEETLNFPGEAPLASVLAEKNRATQR